MATRRKPTTLKTLTLTLDGNEITAEKFVKSVAAFVALIRDVTETLSGEKNAIKWIVTVEKGSARVHFTPKSIVVSPAVVRSTIRAVRNGFKQIEQRGGRPNHWSDAALKSAKEMVSIYAPGDRGIESITVAADDDSLAVTRKTGVNVDTLVGVETRAYGTIEGRLRTVTESGGPK